MKKKIIIIGIAVVLIILVIARSKKSTAEAIGSEDDNASTNSAGTGGRILKVDTSKDDYWASGTGKGKQEHEAGEVQNQSKPTLSDSQSKALAKKWHSLFDWIFFDNEFDILLDDCKENIFTRADIFKVMNEDSYVYNHVYSWIVNDPNPNRLKRFNQVLASNGVEYQFERGEK